MKEKNIFTKLKNVPQTQLRHAPCVWFGDEILICGGQCNSVCYSYNTVSDEYRVICNYPEEVNLIGHAVVALRSEKKDEVTLLSFGGFCKHTLIMRYKSVWAKNSADESSHTNEWVATSNIIGSPDDDLRFVRALIGGENNEVLFICHPPHHVRALDAHTFKCIAKCVLPKTNGEITGGSCFVKTRQPNEVILFNKANCAWITFHKVKKNLRDNDIRKPSVNFIFAFSLHTKKWKACKRVLPHPIAEGFAVISPDYSCIHIIGGYPYPYHFGVDIQDLVGPFVNGFDNALSCVLDGLLLLTKSLEITYGKKKYFFENIISVLQWKRRKLYCPYVHCTCHLLPQYSLYQKEVAKSSHNIKIKNNVQNLL
ncbi:hypothetical protein RFI_16038 [Reticulomyxa filosa]|uniref:Uncharacterized protein n=1 Tax=Reticulomyxa filosa TaxID=46433 RepID=X6N4E7_RETFI|nr:hypothetical protein RFI_16038 [Reticulomyxa filosa]|eukprot:ETO21165.1 hypothetical protein RFI_16038 [Reticulomyxa filosa]